MDRTVGSCPRPDKKEYASEAAARFATGYPGLSTYKCACEKWHVGRMSLNQRIKVALGK